MTELLSPEAPPAPHGAHHLARYAWPALLSTGIAALAAGFALLALRDTGLAPAILGGYLILSGIGQLPVPFATHLGSSRVLALLAADGYVIFGTLCLNKHLGTPALVALWAGLAMIIRGLTWQNATLMNKAMPVRGLQGLAGLAVLLSGDLILGVRPDSPAGLSMIAGPVLILTGALEAVTAIRLRSAAIDPEEESR
ncbi:hypothetical protein KIH27_12740 [Mycobacterium sp. M1]|uniref:DUF308 domain-containing protein n=1 Tax=Mycolicibacter acidiphilus TaxID=2835306 RepID=A0ABS5RJH3_9MYCO|nr:hypothetical protein [Mycolicibacter acidiphilus]MBS9534453.1 hypothetical protein [Mycolicibacter acidiphilus]